MTDVLQGELLAQALLGEAAVGDHAVTVGEHGQEAERQAALRQPVGLARVDPDLPCVDAEHGKDGLRPFTEVTAVGGDQDQLGHAPQPSGRVVKSP